MNLGAPGGLAPLCANQVLYQADRVLFLGARLDLGTTAFQRDNFGAQAERVFVDVDPHELAKFDGLADSRTLAADLRGFPAACDALGAADDGREAGWLDWCEQQRADYLPEERRRLTVDSLNVFGVARRLSSWTAARC